ncbi:zinc-dependent alcohol dehydrogenase [Amycolatopsis alkalitolerans]|uniref:Zinc-binding dehydrogenase n=1 Tax=Amycolatopsis alkalitolerans TaxID=2547244 RepID=A0A5C4LTX0_9PSEU|nr:alcohol dehydrogenase catalytic domain-containing protein [Amycolatopsis alkalitolerans]TNC22255.1 zinc-binding dehydrogenase [Amycolatopsis alkalitolerans]
MTAAVFAGDGRLELTERAVPRIECGTDVLLAVESCGICGTDLKILSTPQGHDATPGVILGHEFVGTVRDLGADVASLHEGDRVVVAPNIACGQCRWCLRGAWLHCENFTTHGIFLDGGLAPFARVPASACHRISPEVPPHIAALAEPLSTVVHGAQLAAVFPGETAVVIGAGPIGLLYTALLRHAGATVLVIEPAAQRAGLARTMGAAAAPAPNSAELRHTLDATTGGLGADVVIDAVGSQFSTALQLVRKRGRVILFGANATATAPITQYDITRNQLQVFGAYVGQDVFPVAVRLLEQRAMDLEPLITHRVALEQLPQALDDLRAGRAVKVQVEFH